MPNNIWWEREEETWSSFDVLAPGIHVYRNVLLPEMNVVKTLEDYLSDNNDGNHWMPAKVWYETIVEEYRKCLDFKFKPSMYSGKPTDEKAIALCTMYDDAHYRQLQAVKHYSQIHNIAELRYWEATNFVKYGVGDHFVEHVDHGSSYNCTVSLIGYVNDDYDGGELEFPFWGIKYKPIAGDLIIFPSNFMYPHKTLPIISGTKYSLVTMLDYSAKYHNGYTHSETGD